MSFCIRPYHRDGDPSHAPIHDASVMPELDEWHELVARTARANRGKDRRRDKKAPAKKSDVTESARVHSNCSS